MIDLREKKILVTGANSMVGRSVIKALFRRHAEVDPVYHEQCDLLNYQNIAERVLQSKPDYCIHAAGYNGNIKFNQNFPSDIFYNTTIMGLNTLKACALLGVKKIVSPLASCAYRSTDKLLKEEDFHLGMPDSSVEAHGLSKKAIFYYSRQIHKQYGVQAVCTIFNTVYGPHDSYDINKTKVVGGLIKKFIDAVENGEEEVICWGTGIPRRELIYCDDAAEGIVQTLEKYNDVDWPINIGFNQDINIKELAETISRLASFKGKIIWDTTRPDGQYRKLLNSDRMKEYDICIKNPIFLEDGLKKTIEWYEKERK
jgi:GDP-L-fucose synthase